MRDERTDTEERRGLSRRTLLARAGVAAAAAGLAGCGTSQRQQTVSSDVDATDLPTPPPSQPPLNCQVFSFFTLDEADTVDAFTARIVPGDANDPGAHEACVVKYIDAKLAQFPSFATPTYFEPPYAKPVPGPEGPQPGATKQILVQKKDLGRYGFQSSLTPQETYREGLVLLDRFARAKHKLPFVELAGAQQDEIVKALETANPDPPSVARKQKDMADPRAAIAKAKAKHAKDLQTPEQQLLAKIFVKPSAYGFFVTLQQDTIEGMFADPIYGGNRDFAGWRLLRYPGAQRAWTPRELTHGPNHRTIQGLAQMPPMNPGVPQVHVILPIEGTRRTAS